MLDLETYLRFVLVLVFVLALIGVLAWVAKRSGLMGRLTATRSGARRLSVVEVLPLDARHRLVLLRRDRVEHLVLMGPGDSLVVEPEIRRPQAGTEPELIGNEPRKPSQEATL